MKSCVQSLELHKTGCEEGHTCNGSTCEAEAGGREVWGRPQLQGEFKAILKCMTPCFKEQKPNNFQVFPG